MVKKATLKFIREEQSEPPIPEELRNIKTPRSIDIDSFTRARELELEHFLKILSTKTAKGGNMGNKKGFQLLPRHMRRRAMSHNSHRVPARIRVQQQSSASLSRPCRRQRRHTTNMLKDYERRNRDFKWLETHIWHAKRMKIEKKWGWSVPIKLNDKSTRAVYRFARDDCVLYDSSYYWIAKVYGMQEPRDELNGVTIDVLDYENYSICVVHPAGKERVIQGINENGWIHEDLDLQVTVIRLRGPKSSLVLSKVLEIQEAEAADLLLMGKDYSYIGIPDNTVLSFTTTVPVSTGRQPKVSREYLAPTNTLIPNAPGRALLLKTMNCESQRNPEFWDSLEPGKITSNAPSTVTRRSTRSRYPSAKQLQGKTTETLETVQEESPREKGVRKESCSGVLVFRKGKLTNSFADGWDLYLPAGNAMAFWKGLVFAGGKAIGLKEYTSILFEQGISSYPEDYPGNREYLEVYFNELFQTHSRRPPAKRTNYYKIGYPLLKTLELSEGILIPIRILCDKRVPGTNSLLFLNDTDSVLIEPIHTEDSQNSELNSERLGQITPVNEAIGFITTGGFSFHKTKGYGIGYMINGPRPRECLFRNPTSRHYHPCKILYIN